MAAKHRRATLLSANSVCARCKHPPRGASPLTHWMGVAGCSAVTSLFPLLSSFFGDSSPSLVVWVAALPTLSLIETSSHFHRYVWFAAEYHLYFYSSSGGRISLLSVVWSATIASKLPSRTLNVIAYYSRALVFASLIDKSLADLGIISASTDLRSLRR